MPICVHPWEIMFPLIALIYTDIPSFRGNPCSSVVGRFPTEGRLSSGMFLTTEPHGTARNQGYVSRVSVLICAIRGIFIPTDYTDQH
jgi:hypothetical protein